MKNINKTTVIGVLLVILVALFFLFNRTGLNSRATLTGTVTYSERVALPAGSVVEVEISDVSRTDTPAFPIASTSIITTGENVPIPFTLEYNTSDLDSSLSYEVFARILVDGDISWVTTENVPLLVNGVPISDVDLVLTSAAGQSPAPTPVASVNIKAKLKDKTFRLVSFNGIEVSEDENYTLVFEEDQIGAKFCNSMGGEYTLVNGILRAPEMISTLMHCAVPKHLMDVENLFSFLVSKGAALSLAGDTLVLADARNSMTFKVSAE